ncbi:MAG: hypothetical protein H0U13_14965, partial [Gemmatimonadaceae bacterium]|nr:hypothetical protein [Gemmatimonadaceae bacterium]
MTRPSRLSVRPRFVLDARPSRSDISRRLGMAKCIAIVAVVLPLASIEPWTETATAATVSSVPPSSAIAANVAASPVASPFGIVRAIHVPNVGGVAFPAPIPSVPRSASPSASAVLPRAQPQNRNCWEASDKSSTRTSIHNENDTRRESTTIRYSNGDCSLELRAEGKFTFRTDLSDIETLARGGWMRVEERTGRDSRRLEIRSSAAGVIDRVYYLNGDRSAIDANARAWFARALLAVERQSAFAAETRVPQLWKAGGLRAVLAEVALMPSDHAASKYYTTLLGLDADLNSQALNTIIRQATNDLAGSDHYLSQMLGKFASHRTADAASLRLFADATGRMKSDHYKSQLMMKVLGTENPGPETVNVLLRSASTIESDYYLSQVLTALAKASPVESWSAYFKAASGIESDYYKRQTLEAPLAQRPLTKEVVNGVLTAALSIGSDHYLSELLMAVAVAYPMDNATRPAYERAVDAIGSDHYRGKLLV